MGIHTIYKFCDEIQTKSGLMYIVPPENVTSCDYSWNEKNGNVLAHHSATEKHPLVVDWNSGSLTLSECLYEIQYVPLSIEPCGPTDIVKFIVSNRDTWSSGTDTSYLWFLSCLLPVIILIICLYKWRHQILRRLRQFCCGGPGQDNRNSDDIQLDTNIRSDRNGETQPLNSNHGSPVEERGVSMLHDRL